MKRTVLPSITTIGLAGSTWRDKIREVREHSLSSVALFVTALSDSERTECVHELRRARREHYFTIPFIHAVSTMTDDEYRIFMAEFGTEHFNLHPVRSFPLLHPLSREIRQRIFIENSGDGSQLLKEDLNGFAGVCLDLSHLQDLALLDREQMLRMVPLLYAFPIGANHISAIFANPVEAPNCRHHSSHVARSLDDFEYLRDFPLEFFSRFCAIEVENSLSEQLHYKERIESIIQEIERSVPQAA